MLLDDAYWPAFTTVRAHSSHERWEYIGEGFIKELDFGRVWLRLNDADEGEKDDVIAEYKGDAKKFLDDALVSPSCSFWLRCSLTVAAHQDGPAHFTLTDKSDSEKASIVEIEARYVPVPIKLEPRESVNSKHAHYFHIEDASLTLRRRSGSSAGGAVARPRYPCRGQRRLVPCDPVNYAILLIVSCRQIRSIRRLLAQRTEDVQVADKEENGEPRLE